MIDRISNYILLAIFALTPILYSSANSELFEIPKMSFVYLSTGIITFSFCLNLYRRHHLPRLHLPFVIFIIITAVSTYFSFDPYTSLHGYYSRLNGGLISLLAFFLLFHIIRGSSNRPSLTSIISFSLLSGFLISIFGIFQHFGIDDHLWSQDVQSRVFATLGQPNWLAAFLCTLLPFLIHRLVFAHRPSSRLFYFLALTAYLLCLVFTKSQSGLATAIIITFLFSAYFVFSTRHFLVTHHLSLITLILFLLLFPNPLRQHILPPPPINPQLAQEPANPAETNITPSSQLRQLVWTGGLKLGLKYPLLGTGPETFAYGYYLVRPVSHNLTSEWEYLYNKAHNELINQFATTGFLGLLSYLALILSLLWLIIKSQLDGQTKIALLLSQLAIHLTNFFGFSTATSQIFLFLLPAFAAPHIARPNPLSPILAKLLAIIFLFISFRFISYSSDVYLADLTYADSQRLLSANRPLESIAKLNYSLHYRPQEPTYLIKKASTLGQLGQIDEAVNITEDTLRQHPLLVNLWKERALVYFYLSQKQPSLAPQIIESLTIASRLAPTDPKIPYLLSQVYIQNQQYTQAIQSLLLAINLKSNYDHAHFLLGEIYFGQKDYPLALDHFQKALAINPKNTAANDYITKIKSALQR